MIITTLEKQSLTFTVRLFSKEEPFTMVNGAQLGPVDVAYETFGNLNPAGDNAILVCHALTGSAHAAGMNHMGIGWWDSLIGRHKVLDTNKYFIVCSNFLGSCYGTTGPASIDPETGRPYGITFPQMTVRDMVQLQKALLDHLGVKNLVTVIGGSLGGMQVLEWSIMFPEMVQSMIPIAASAKHSAWAISLNSVSRQCILNDPEWLNGNYYGIVRPIRGLALARQIAMISYRTYDDFETKFGRDQIYYNDVSDSSLGQSKNMFQVESYLHYQGEKLVNRFDANTYLYILRSMDLHDITHGRGEMHSICQSISIPTQCIGIDSDILYPVEEQKMIADMIPKAQYSEIHSSHGHDAFLIEFDQLGRIIKNFLSDF